MALWSALLARPTRPSLDLRPSFTLFYLLVGAFLLTLVPHYQQLPLWVSASVGVAMVIRCIIEFYRLPLPSSTFCAIIAAVLLGCVLFQFRTIFGRDAGMAFTVGLLAIKFYEVRRPRDIALIIFSCFFIVMSALLYSQVLELFIYCLIMMWVLTALLLRVHTGDTGEDRLLRMLRRSGLVFLQALPLTVCLFIFFPRYSGKFQLNLGESSLGITNTVQPGSISRLANDDSEAMRVVVTGKAIPTPDSMYWRALVLTHYENGAWTPGMAAFDNAPQPRSVEEGDEVFQEITVFPHYQKWLFALDVPVKPPINALEPPNWALILYGDVLQLGGGAFDKVDHKERYTVTSAPEIADTHLGPGEFNYDTQLPVIGGSKKVKLDPRVIALADRLYQENPDEQAYVLAVLRYFRHEHFVYSTDPGAAGPDWLAPFLFQTKTGFCEHFASAFAVLMRLEKFPTRLVTGYHGADYNPYGNFYMVLQSNAHAWDEVWFESKKHWIRIDPTAVINASENSALASANSGGAAGDDELSLQVTHQRGGFLNSAFVPEWARQAIRETEFRRQEVEANWDNWVFSYDPDTQDRLAQALGFGDQSHTVFLLICLATAGACLMIFQRFIRRKPTVSPVESLYASFCRNMAQRGIPRASWEGPLAYTERVGEALPDRRDAIIDVGWIVARTRYGAAPADPEAPENLKSLLVAITASPAASNADRA